MIEYKGQTASQRQRNAITKARIKAKRAPTLKAAFAEVVKGITNFTVIGFLEKVVCGESWVAIRK